MLKKRYSMPQLKTYGNVKDVTRQLKQYASPNDGYTYEGKDIRDCSKCVV